MEKTNKQQTNYLDNVAGFEKIKMVPVEENGNQSLYEKTPETIPEGMNGKGFTLKTDNSTKDPQVFFASKEAFKQIPYDTDSAAAKTYSDPQLEGWERSRIKNPQEGSRTKFLDILKNTKDENAPQFIAIPITDNHFANSHVNATRENPCLIIEENVFKKNQDFTLHLDHEQLPLTRSESGWVVDPKSEYAPYITFKSGNMDPVTPQEIYVLNQEELDSYGAQGSRRGWRQGSNKDLRDKSTLVFEKVVPKEFQPNPKPSEIRHAKQIIVNGEKKYIISTKENIANIKINPKPKIKNKFEQSKSSHSNIEQKISEKKYQSSASDLEKAIYDAFNSTVKSLNINGSEYKNLKGKRNDIIAEAKNMPEPDNKQTLSAFAQKISVRKNNLEQKDPHEKEFLGNIYKNIEKILKEKASQDDNLSANIEGQDNKEKQNSAFLNRELPNNPNQAESMAANVAGTAAGTVIGTAGAIISLATGVTANIGSALGKMVDKHHARKMERLKNPELAEQELAAKKEKAQGYRVDRANMSNQILDAKMEAAITHRNAINNHPSVQAIHNMVEEDPSRIWEAQEDMSELISSNPELKHHHKELMRNVKDVTRSVTENLEKNSLAGMSIDDRKEKLAAFNKDLANDPLADTLKEDQGVDSKTLRESLQEMASKIAKWLKEFIRQAKNSFGSGPFAQGQEQSPPPQKTLSM